MNADCSTKQKKVLAKVCTWCGDPFNTTERSIRSVCNRCTRVLREVRKYCILAKQRVRCAECGIECTPRTFDRSVNNYCSRRCRERYDNRKKKNARRVRGKDNAGVSRSELRERDGDYCTLCAMAIDFELSGNHPMGATVDHIVPIAVGGENTIDNMALAHRQCNMVKKTNTSDYQISTVLP